MANIFSSIHEFADSLEARLERVEKHLGINDSDDANVEAEPTVTAPVPAPVVPAPVDTPVTSSDGSNN